MSHSYGLCSNGPCSYGLCNYGLHSHGLYSYGVLLQLPFHGTCRRTLQCAQPVQCCGDAGEGLARSALEHKERKYVVTMKAMAT